MRPTDTLFLYAVFFRNLRLGMKAIDQQDEHFLRWDGETAEDFAHGGELLRWDLHTLSSTVAQLGEKEYFDHMNTSFINYVGGAYRTPPT